MYRLLIFHHAFALNNKTLIIYYEKNTHAIDTMQ